MSESAVNMTSTCGSRYVSRYRFRRGGGTSYEQVRAGPEDGYIHVL